MGNLDDLIKSIEDPRREDDLGAGTTPYLWKIKLTKLIPGWEAIVKKKENWTELELARPRVHYSGLCVALVEAGGWGLAKRWLNSEVPDQRAGVRKWLIKFIDASMWQECDRGMKNDLLEARFKEPGEPFEMLKQRRPLTYITGYVPSPEIEKLRSVIEDARDQEYLTRIDEMISRREKACKVISSQMQHRIPYTPSSNERELIARIMEITRYSGYLPAALPPIFISYETPPIFIAYPELEEDADEYQIGNEDQIPRNRERRRPETISIEELLGVYQPRDQQIIIYERGIKWREHRLDEKWLLSVVLIHEIGHWITHLLPKPGVPTWATDLYVLGETNLHEGWAQLITWWIAYQVGGRFKSTFEKLNQGQSPAYHIFEQFKDKPIDKVMESLERLRNLSWPARLQDWEQILG